MLVLVLEIINWNILIFTDNTSTSAMEFVCYDTFFAFICDDHSVRNGCVKHECVFFTSKSQFQCRVKLIYSLQSSIDKLASIAICNSGALSLVRKELFNVVANNSCESSS